MNPNRFENYLRSVPHNKFLAPDKRPLALKFFRNNYKYNKDEWPVQFRFVVSPPIVPSKKWHKSEK